MSTLLRTTLTLGCAGWLHEVQWVLCTAFWSMNMTCVYACLFEAVCDVTTVPSPLKARGWWPLSRSSTKIFFWRFVFLWVNLALLNPIERFSWRVCVVEATKKEEESCSFLDAIGRRSCGPLSRLTKNRQVGKPKLRSRQLVGTLRYALTLSSDVTCTSTHVRVSLVSPLHAYRWACYMYWKRSSRQR